MSDHGEMLGDHGIYFKGPHFYDCQLRIPLIMRWPAGGVLANRRVEGLIELVDLAPTFLDAANLEIPNQIFADYKMINIAAALGLFCLSLNKINLRKLNLEKIKDLPGRLEKINVASNKYCYIDYAHTPDALEKVLQSLKNKYRGNLICLFGCGGDRDQGKRVLMGSVADSLADKIILTNDNPRFENPNQIVMHISEGIKNIKKVKIITDRTKAIKYGLKLLREDRKESVLLLAGKGHEFNQEIKRKTFHSNDYEIVRSLI